MEIPHSGIREIMDLSSHLENIIHLEVGQPDFKTPSHIVKATCSYLSKGYTKYIPNAGMEELRVSVAKYFERKTGIRTEYSNILITPGAVFSVATAFLTILNPGDEVLLPDPGWPNYVMAASLINAVPVFYNLSPNNNFLPNIEELNSLITPKTKILVICNPSNPTGQVYNSDIVKGFLKLASKYDLFLLSDEIYSEIVFNNEYISALVNDTDERTLIISGMSKSYSMTGYRVGFTRARTDYIEIATKIQEAFVSCGSGFNQLASVDAIDGPQDCVIQMKEAYKYRRDIVLDILLNNNLYKYTPEGAFYLLIDISSTGMNSRDFSFRLLEEKKVAVAPGDTFGKMSRDYIRISFASSEENLIEGVKRICTMIKESKKNSNIGPKK
jgi:aspartate/methionine/tyrosine aminotransferase